MFCSALSLAHSKKLTKETRERLFRSTVTSLEGKRQEKGFFAPLTLLLSPSRGGGTHEQKKTTHQRLLELRVGVLVRLDVLALAFLVVVVLVLLRAHLAPGEVVDKVHARVVGGQRPQLEKVAPVAVEAVLAVDELRVGHVDRGVALEEVGDGVLVAKSRVVGVLLLMFFKGCEVDKKKSEFFPPLFFGGGGQKMKQR